MTVSAEFLDFLKEQMAGFGEVTVRRMFGGAGLYRDGLMFALVDRDVLYLKTDEESRKRFDAEGLPPFTYEMKGGQSTIMSYMRAPERCLDDTDDMTEWCRLALDAARRAAAPKSGKKRK